MVAPFLGKVIDKIMFLFRLQKLNSSQLASQPAQEVVYLREILRDFGCPQCTATGIFEDNLACIVMSQNPVRRKFARHIDIRQFLVREYFAHTKWSLMH